MLSSAPRTSDLKRITFVLFLEERALGQRGGKAGERHFLSQNKSIDVFVVVLTSWIVREAEIWSLLSSASQIPASALEVCRRSLWPIRRCWWIFQCQRITWSNGAAGPGECA